MCHQATADTDSLTLGPNGDQAQIPHPSAASTWRYSTVPSIVLDNAQPALSAASQTSVIVSEQRGEHLSITGLKQRRDDRSEDAVILRLRGQ